MRVYEQLFLKEFISLTKSDKYSIFLSSRKITITNTYIYLSSTTSFRQILLWSYSQYRSGSKSCSESQCEGSVDESVLTQQQVRSVYLLTYRQADLSIFPDKESFASAVCKAVSVRRNTKREEHTITWQLS